MTERIIMSATRSRKSPRNWRRISVAKGAKRLAFHLCEINGARPGPTLSLIAGQHGMEPTGPAMLACLAEDLDPAQLRGRLLIVPITYANAIRCGNECEPIPRRQVEHRRSGRWHNDCPYGLNRNTCGRNLNRLWPGDDMGTIYERLVAAVWRRAIVPADYVVDFHCWQDWAPPGIITCGEASEEIARYIGIKCIQTSGTDDEKRKLLAPVATRAGKIAVTVEYTPQTRINPDMIAGGDKGVRNLMRHLGMLPGRAEPTRPLYYASDRPVDDKHFTAACDVIVRPFVKPEQEVRRGQALARLIPIDRPDRPSILRAPYSGVVFNMFGSAVVARGDRIMYIRRPKTVRR